MTPNFKEYTIRIDDGAWRPSADSFLLDAHPGVNRVEARTVNQFGVEGPVSTAELEVAQ